MTGRLMMVMMVIMWEKNKWRKCFIEEEEEEEEVTRPRERYRRRVVLECTCH
jgi:hypothetical protein